MRVGGCDRRSGSVIVAGITVWYLALVGMMERLTTLIVVGTDSMVAVLIVLPPAVGGWLVSRPRIVAGERRETSMRSAVVPGRPRRPRRGGSS